jgi:FKBP-type peptidyl-prolyl cis-trans isomerase FkpA
MKKLIFVLLVISLAAYFGCGKSVPITPACMNALPFSDSTALLKFADDSIKTTLDSSGIFYQILDSGSSTKATANSYVKVTYIGKLMSNVIFDSATNSTLGGNTPANLIPAWQFAFTKIGVGGRIKILVPSIYAYGCTGYGTTIPSNSPLYFDITLVAIL